MILHRFKNNLEKYALLIIDTFWSNYKLNIFNSVIVHNPSCKCRPRLYFSLLKPVQRDSTLKIFNIFVCFEWTFVVVTAKFSNFYFTMYADWWRSIIYMLTGPLKTYNKFNLMLPMSIENGSYYTFGELPGA